MPSKWKRWPVARCQIGLLLVLWWGVSASFGGILDALHIRSKAEKPLETDHPGFEVSLLDTRSDEFLVSGVIRVPDSFGKVLVAALLIRGPDGKNLGETSLAPAIPPAKTQSFEFNLSRELLQNSTVTVSHDAGETVDLAVFHLGSFGVRDYHARNGLPPAPKIQVSVAEQGLYDDTHREFTPTDRVPLLEGQSYGFRLYLRGGNGGSVPLRVEQTLPAAPKTWGSEEAIKRLKISEDGRTATYTEVIPTEKLYENGGVIVEGDPAGDYVCKLFVQDTLVKTFVFHIQPPAVVPDPPPAHLPQSVP